MVTTLNAVNANLLRYIRDDQGSDCLFDLFYTIIPVNVLGIEDPDIFDYISSFSVVFKLFY